MADWSVNSRACTSVWLALRLLEQSKKVFKVSGTIPVKKFLFWNPTASAEMRRLQATTLAKQMDNIFRQIDGATLEKGVTVTDAVAGMVGILVDADQTMADLAELCDANYRFWGEP
jgi:hypothetical protein